MIYKDESVLISCNSYDNRWTPDELLKKFYSALDSANALSAEGIHLHLFFRFHKNFVKKENQVQFHFIHDNLPPRVSNRNLFASYLGAIKTELSKIKVDIIHTHNFEGALSHILLYYLLKELKAPIILQDHGSLPRMKMLLLQKIAFLRINGFLFVAHGQEKPWIQKRLITEKNRCFFVMESSSPFQYVQRDIARNHSGWTGYPIFIWVGNLTKNKDPLTIINAFESSLKVHPDSKLYMIYIRPDLEEEVQIKLRSNSLLQKAVAMIGPVKRSSLEMLYNSADYCLIGSAKEGSGFAVIEAISCGEIPIVTKIPSFEAITDNGRYGRLFNLGSRSELETILRSLDLQTIPRERAEVHAHFIHKFSSQQLAKQLIRVYEQIQRSFNETSS